MHGIENVFVHGVDGQSQFLAECVEFFGEHCKIAVQFPNVYQHEHGKQILQNTLCHLCDIGIAFCTDTADLMEKSVYYLLDKEAESVPIGSERLLYLPYLMGERTPHLDPDARGVFFGLSAMHTKKHLLRAIMEGVAYSLRDCADICSEMGTEINDMMACGGGGSSMLWREMLADLYKCPVKTVTCKEGPALGVAILALVGAGVYESVQAACSEIIKVAETQAPSEKRSAEYEKFYSIYKALYPSIKEHYKMLSKI